MIKKLLVYISLSIVSGSFLINELLAEESNQVTIKVWHSYTGDTIEDEVYSSAIVEFEKSHPHITVNSVRVPYAQLVQQFITAAQGGESPDLIRITSQELAKIGQVSINGMPILEDLRPHLTPMEKLLYEPISLQSMRFNNALYAIPASQSTLSLIYNKDLFDEKNISYPSDSWTLTDFLSAAKALTDDEIQGLALPFKVFIWWAPFHLGFGGSLFDENGQPSLGTEAGVQAMQWLLDLEHQHKIVAKGKGYDIENVKTSFIQSRIAMAVDGSWNWTNYRNNGLNIGQSLLPLVPSTGKRISPLLYYIGWSVAKQSTNKVEAVLLAQWLSSRPVQKKFAIEAFTLPTIQSLKMNSEILKRKSLSGFLRQVEFGTPAPTTNAMNLMIKPLETAVSLTYDNLLAPQAALHNADIEIQRLMEK